MVVLVIHANHKINLQSPFLSYFFLDEKVSKKSRLQMMKGAHLPSAECLRRSPRRLGASSPHHYAMLRLRGRLFSGFLRRLTPPII
jgi:hypothetical protein